MTFFARFFLVQLILLLSIESVLFQDREKLTWAKERLRSCAEMSQCCLCTTHDT